MTRRRVHYEEKETMVWIQLLIFSDAAGKCAGMTAEAQCIFYVAAAQEDIMRSGYDRGLICLCQMPAAHPGSEVGEIFNGNSCKQLPGVGGGISIRCDEEGCAVPEADLGSFTLRRWKVGVGFHDFKSLFRSRFPGKIIKAGIFCKE